MTPGEVVTLRRELIWLFAPLVGLAVFEAAIRAEAYILGKGEQPDEDDAAPADIDTVTEWLVANGDRVAITGNGGWRLNGTSGWSERDLVKRANGKRAELGLPAFSLGRR